MIEIEVRVTHPKLPKTAVSKLLVDELLVEACGLRRSVQDCASVAADLVEGFLSNDER